MLLQLGESALRVALNTIASDWAAKELAVNGFKVPMLDRGRLVKRGRVGMNSVEKDPVGGVAIHETGTARVGHDPAEPMLNRWNQRMTHPNCLSPTAFA